MTNKNFWFTAIAMIISAAVGYYANVYANRKNNDLLVQMIKDNLNCIDNEQQSGRTSQERSDYLTQRKAYLQTELNRLTA